MLQGYWEDVAKILRGCCGDGGIFLLIKKKLGGKFRIHVGPRRRYINAI